MGGTLVAAVGGCKLLFFTFFLLFFCLSVAAVNRYFIIIVFAFGVFVHAGGVRIMFLQLLKQ